MAEDARTRRGGWWTMILLIAIVVVVFLLVTRRGQQPPAVGGEVDTLQDTASVIPPQGDTVDTGATEEPVDTVVEE